MKYGPPDVEGVVKAKATSKKAAPMAKAHPNASLSTIMDPVPIGKSVQGSRLDNASKPKSAPPVQREYQFRPKRLTRYGWEYRGYVYFDMFWFCSVLQVYIEVVQK